MKHDMDQIFYFCKWCGKSMVEVIEDDVKCHGTSGIFHIEYLKNKKEFDIIMSPILNRLQ
jgi:hypothetical protein